MLMENHSWESFPEFEENMYDITDEKRLFVEPDDHENFQFVQNGKKKFPELFDDHIKSIDKALHSANPTKDSPLVIASMADIDELFSSVGTKMFPTGTRDRTDLRDKMILVYVGGMVRWRASLCDESEGWVVYRQDSGKSDKWTDRNITKSYYWKEPTPTKKLATSSEIAALKAKINK